MDQNQSTASATSSDLRRAASTWALWLVTHPGFVLTQTYADLNCILGQSFAMSTPLKSFQEATADAVATHPGAPVVSIQHGAHRLAPTDFVDIRVRFWITLVSVMILAVSLMRVRRKYVLASLFVVAAGFSNATGAYFSDLWAPAEMLRHALVGAVVFNVGFLVSLVSVAALALEALGKPSHPA